MSTFTWAPSYGAQATEKPRVLSAKYGDGYEQRISYGINFLAEVWNLSFVGDIAYITAIEGFFDAAAGVSSFDWTTPDGLTAKFLCREWTRVRIDSGAMSLQATFEQVFGE